MYYCCGISEKGTASHNEDALLIGKQVITEGTFEAKLKSPFIMAVSDGVSGELSGEVASEKCLGLISEIKYNSKTDIGRKLIEVHRRLAVLGCESMSTLNMQATLCGIAVDEDGNVRSVNAGDSRLYRFRGGRIRQISKDQSLVQMMYEEGSISQEELKNHVKRNIIFPVLGNVAADPTIVIEELDGGIQYGDIFLLCTDGLSDYLSPIDMEEILDLPKSLPKRLELMVKKALDKGGSDNITVAAAVNLP